MRTIKCLIVVLAASFITCASYTAWSAPEGKPPMKPKPGGKPPYQISVYILDCFHDGSPVEFPNDISIYNKGNTKVKEGTIIKWTSNIDVGPDSGFITLKEDLLPGKYIFLSNVISVGGGAGLKCQAEVVQLIPKPKKRK